MPNPPSDPSEANGQDDASFQRDVEKSEILGPLAENQSEGPPPGTVLRRLVLGLLLLITLLAFAVWWILSSYGRLFGGD